MKIDLSELKKGIEELEKRGADRANCYIADTQRAVCLNAMDRKGRTINVHIYHVDTSRRPTITETEDIL